MPAEIKYAICKQDEIGEDIYFTFVKERFQSNKTNIWNKMVQL